MSSKKSKTSRSRPQSTSILSQPTLQGVSSLYSLSSFSPSANLFAFLSLAVDKHRLRVYDTTLGQSTAEYVVDSARVTALTWLDLNLADTETTSPNKKKRRKRDSISADVTSSSKTPTQVILLGLSNGSVELFSPSHGRVVKTLADASSTSAIHSFATWTDDDASRVWSSSADGVVRLWNTSTNSIEASWKTDDRVAYSSMAARGPSSEDEDGSEVLVATHNIKLLALSPNSEKPSQTVSFTGHASPIKSLSWDGSAAPPTRFFTSAESDRFVYVWQTPSDSSTEGKIVASIPLDSDARTISISVPTTDRTQANAKQTLLTISASGKISVFPVPSELLPPASANKTAHKVPTLIPRSIISTSAKKGAAPVEVINASFLATQQGHIRVARIVGGVQPVFDLVQYLDDSGNFVAEVTLEEVSAALVTASTQNVLPNKRYAENSSLAVASGGQLGQDADMEDSHRALDGELDVDVAELSLGQRLTALSGDPSAVGNLSSDEEGEPPSKPKKAGDRQTSAQQVLSVVPASSLTRTLIQALHSSDSRLLETCLAHSNLSLIRNTVRKLPPQLAVPLIDACVERLGRGARVGNGKGGGAGASAQRGAGLNNWIKTVLAVHGGHLMTMPDLVIRLSALHSTLTSRLALQESLLSLTGRLDMVLSQIEMRSSTAPTPVGSTNRTASSAPHQQKRQVARYVEGESDSDEDDDEAGMEVDSGDEGSVEDVDLGGESGEEEEEDDDDDEEDEEDEDEDGTMNGFIDDEAEEAYSDEDEEDESE